MKSHSEAAAFQATFADWKLIKGRKVVQVVFEVPIEHSGLAYDVLGGMPDPGKSVWCAIARLQEQKEEHHQDKPKKAWTDIKPGSQAGILCNDPAFQKFLAERYEGGHDAAAFVRSYCGVKSRSEIVYDSKAKHRWNELVEQYRVWQRYPEFADAP